MELDKRQQNFANAFNCKACPGNDGPDGCPNWWRWQETNEKGAHRIVEQCGFVAAKFFEVQRLGNTQFVVDNVVATKNVIQEVAQKAVRYMESLQQLQEFDAAQTKEIPNNVQPFPRLVDPS